MRNLSFVVYGAAVPQGSKRAFVNRHTGKASLVEQAGSKLRNWQGDVKYAAIEALGGGGWELLRTPMWLSVEFTFPRPKSHTVGGKGKVLKADVPIGVTKRPDLDKLVRGVCDALTGVVWDDDQQITRISASKVYCDLLQAPCATIHVTEVEQ